MRPSLLFLLLLTASMANAQGPYSVLLVSGDTLTGKEYFIKGDTLGIRGGQRAALKDVVLLWTPKERWTFTYPEGRRERLKEELTGSCARSSLARLRNSDRLTPFDSLPIPSTWRSDTSLRTCYEGWLMEQPIFFDDEPGAAMTEEYQALRKVTMDESGGVAIGAPSEIIFLSGDTLLLKKEFHEKEGLLCWYGGGCLSVDTILLFRNVKGQFYYNAIGGRRFQLQQGVPDMSVGSLARIHANRFFSTQLTWEQCAIPDALKNDTLFQQIYRAEVVRKTAWAERLRKRSNNWRIASGALSGYHFSGIPTTPVKAGVGAGIGAGIGTAMGIPPHDRPYYGTPMPPE